MTIKVQLKREVNGVMQQVNPITSEECVILGDGKKLNEVIDFATTAEDFVDETIVIEENLVDRVESMENKIETEFEQQNSQITTGLSNIKTIEQNISNKVDTEVAKVNAQLSAIKEHCTGGNGVQEHSHFNKVVLDNLTEHESSLFYNGKEVGGKIKDGSIDFIKLDPSLFSGKTCYKLSVNNNNGGVTLNVPTLSSKSDAKWKIEYVVSCESDDIVNANVFFGNFGFVRTAYDAAKKFMYISGESDGVKSITQLCILFDVKTAGFRFDIEIFDIKVYCDDIIQEIESIVPYNGNTTISETQFKYNLSTVEDINNINKELLLINDSIRNKAETLNESYKFQFFYNKDDAGLDYLKFIPTMQNDIKLSADDVVYFYFDIETKNTGDSIMYQNTGFVATSVEFQQKTSPTLKEIDLNNGFKRIIISFLVKSDVTIQKDNFNVSPRIYINLIKNGCIIKNIKMTSNESVIYFHKFQPYTPNNYPNREIITFKYLDEDYLTYGALKKIINIDSKHWLAIGDSLTDKNGSASVKYHELVADELGFELTVNGVGGTGYKRGDETSTSRGPFYKRTEVLTNDYDVVTIFGSFNDSPFFTNWGGISDETSETLFGCMNLTIKNIYATNPLVKIGIILPTPWGDSEPCNDDNPHTIYCNNLIKVCKRWGIPFLNLYTSSQLRPWDDANNELFFFKTNGQEGDRVHPNNLGHELFYPRIRDFIRSLV